MVLFGDTRNPSCACWAALGGEPLPLPTEPLGLLWLARSAASGRGVPAE